MNKDMPEIKTRLFELELKMEQLKDQIHLLNEFDKLSKSILTVIKKEQCACEKIQYTKSKMVKELKENKKNGF